MRNIAYKKSNKRLVSFGFEDVAHYDLETHGIVQTSLEELPDELRFCKYENGQVVVDQGHKQQVLQEKADQKQKVQQSRQYIEDNNPAKVSSIPALRERVKRLEVLLGIYKWL